MKSENTNIAIQEVVAIAREAGAEIMRKLTPDIAVHAKEDQSFVTAADAAADAVIKARLRALTPRIPIVSEEDTMAEKRDVPENTLRWVVDPLDGTNTAIEYAKGCKECAQFGVHIALVQGAVPLKGVAFFPAMEEGKGIAYFTGDDGKAYKQKGDAVPRKIHVSRPPFKSEGLRAAVHFHESRRANNTIGGRVYVPVCGVGGQRICLVAEGAADIADMNDIPTDSRGEYAYKQWDLAAAHAILRAAGGELVSAQTQEPIHYSPAASPEMPGAFGGGIETLNFLRLANMTDKANRKQR